MITPAQIALQDMTALSDDQIENLILLVKQYGPYASAPARWPNIRTKLTTEKNSPTVFTKILKAVLAAVDELPEIKADSQGSEGSPGFFSVKENWDALAIDVLNTLYDIPAALGPNSYAVVRRPTESLTQKDRMYFTEEETGRRF